jgi:hypothetical protein
MRQVQSSIGQTLEVRNGKSQRDDALNDDFVLEKSIFSNIFEKDIRRVFIYKKAERLAKAIHLINPAFRDSPSLHSRLDEVVAGLINAAIVPFGTARVKLSRELLALSSVLAIARTGGLLSSMNIELITREAHSLLQEVSLYEEPLLSLEDSLSLSDIAKKALKNETLPNVRPQGNARSPVRKEPSDRPARVKGHIKDTEGVNDIRIKDRREAVMSVIKNKGTTSIKDISTVIRGVSEKTIQRELLTLISEGLVIKSGERRWSTYSLS